jgi:hypothetical protein
LLLVAVEGIEPTSLDYQSSALAIELHRDLECAGFDGALDLGRGQIVLKIDPKLCAALQLVDPTGLKPAPHGLKGRRSVTRAPGQQEWLWRRDSNLR